MFVDLGQRSEVCWKQRLNNECSNNVFISYYYLFVIDNFYQMGKKNHNVKMLQKQLQNVQN